MKTCTIEGCENRLVARGWCGKHYHRWERHGDPLGGAGFRGEVRSYFENVVVKYQGLDCLKWPYARGPEGYGTFEYGPDKSAHRAACRAKHGDPPSARHEAAHSCGNGSDGCCNPHHLRWATRSENQLDRIEHGTSNRGSRHGRHKLTEAEVLQIFYLRGTLSQFAISRKFGVSQPCIAAIHSGSRWGWLTAANDNDQQERKAA